MSIDLMIFDPVTGTSRLATTNDFSAERPLTPLGSVVAITVTTSAATLATLMAAVGAAIDSTCTWIELKIRDDQASTAVVRINYTAAASATSYDASMSLDVSRTDPVSLAGKGSQAQFNAYSLVSSTSAIVLVRQYREA